MASSPKVQELIFGQAAIRERSVRPIAAPVVDGFLLWLKADAQWYGFARDDSFLRYPYKKRSSAVSENTNYALSELLATLESLSLRYQRAKKEFQSETVLLKIADEMNSTLEQVTRQIGAPSRRLSE